MNSDEALRKALCEAFGQECYNAEGLNRSYLAEKVFGDKDSLAKLNSIVHPVVKADFREWAEAQNSAYVVLESAILFESGFDSEVDTTIAVLAPLEERLRRTVSRDGSDRAAVEARMAHQMSDDERSDRSKYAIVNIDIEELREDVEQLHRRLSYDSRAKHD